jgi:hypothetical protein
MTPEEELKKLNRLIRQYETVYRTARDGGQRERVGKELHKLKSYRDKILAVNVIDDRDLEEPPPADEDLSEYPILSRLIKEERDERRNEYSDIGDDSEKSSPAQSEVSRISLYMKFFEREYIPFLTEMRLKLDFKFSLERDGFYGRFQELERKIADYEDEVRRLREDDFTKEMEIEIKKRALKLKRILEAEASRFFRAIKRFTEALLADARSDGVKCLNGPDEIHFDKIEGKRLLAGKRVAEGLEYLGVFAEEIIEFLNVPDIESQENERADRH